MNWETQPSQLFKEWERRSDRHATIISVLLFISFLSVIAWEVIK
jgi:hypothetical protein